MNPRTVLRIKDLSLEIGNEKILDNINLDIYENEILSIVGVSGSGKTTLLSCMIGLFKPTKGDVLFSHKKNDQYEFKSIFKYLDYYRFHVGFSSQIPSFYNKLTIKENLMYFGKMYDIDSNILKHRINSLLELFELKEYEDKLAEELSGGMQKRLDLACAMINNPKILILDEPASELDPLLRKEIWYLIKKINQKGKTIVMSSHFIVEMEQVANRVAILDKGKILTSGTPLELRDEFTHYEKLIIETVPGNYELIERYITKYANIKKVIKEPHKMTIFVTNGQNAIRYIIPILDKLNERIIDLEIRKPSLEEVFESLQVK